jgi:hypothetical protein
MPLDYPSNMPIDDIKEYFGEEIGFYFAFLSHLTSGQLPMVPVAIFAQAVALIMIANGSTAMYAEACFAVFGVCGLSVIMDSWQYRQNEMAHKWACYGCTESQPPRPGQCPD